MEEAQIAHTGAGVASLALGGFSLIVLALELALLFGMANGASPTSVEQAVAKYMFFAAALALIASIAFGVRGAGSIYGVLGLVVSGCVVFALIAIAISVWRSN
ncbi:MAG: hypothetical protein LBC09_03450 [Helicobacteraceae bacterium]|jgi:hypothetical protein|nr:hypothetical protein [Helicobacteraceae bacterium]